MDQLSTTGLFKRLLRIEQEVGERRRALLKLHETKLAQQNPGSLRGIWCDVVLDDQDFTAAKAPCGWPKVPLARW